MIKRMPDRTRFLPRQSLEPDEAKLVDDVEEYGCHIIQLRGETKEKPNGHQRSTEFC